MPATGDLIALDIEKPAAGGRMLPRLPRAAKALGETCLLWLMTDKTRCEHNSSAFGCMATKTPLWNGMLNLSAEPGRR